MNISSQNTGSVNFYFLEREKDWEYKERIGEIEREKKKERRKKDREERIKDRKRENQNDITLEIDKKTYL